MPDFVPPVPGDWATKDAQGTPYLLGVVSGDPEWRAIPIPPAVLANDGHIVTALNGHTVYSLPA